MQLDDEAADAIAVCWLREVRQEARDTMLETKAHLDDRKAAWKRLRACDTLLEYCGRRG